PQQAVNFPLAGVSGVREGYAQRGEIQVRLRVQRSHEPECEELEKLLVRLVEFLHVAGSQYFLLLVRKDLEDERFISSSAVMHQVFERFGDRRQRAGKVEKNANRPHVHLCRDVQPEEWVIRLGRGQLEEPAGKRRARGYRCPITGVARAQPRTGPAPPRTSSDRGSATSRARRRRGSTATGSCEGQWA